MKIKRITNDIWINQQSQTPHNDIIKYDAYSLHLNNFLICFKFNNSNQQLYDKYLSIKRKPHNNIIEVIQNIELRQQNYNITFVRSYHQNILNTSLNSISFLQKLKWMQEITQGINHLHKLNYIHSYLIPQSCFINQSNLCKIGNLQHLIKFTSYTKPSHSNIFQYPPQIIQKNNIDPIKIDIWSQGLLFYYIATGNKLFDGINDLNQLRNKYQSLQTNILPIKNIGLKNLIYKMISIQPNDRPQISTITQQLQIIRLDLIHN